MQINKYWSKIFHAKVFTTFLLFNLFLVVLNSTTNLDSKKYLPLVIKCVREISNFLSRWEKCARSRRCHRLNVNEEREELMKNDLRLFVIIKFGSFQHILPEKYVKCETSDRKWQTSNSWENKNRSWKCLQIRKSSEMLNVVIWEFGRGKQTSYSCRFWVHCWFKLFYQFYSLANI